VTATNMDMELNAPREALAKDLLKENVKFVEEIVK